MFRTVPAIALFLTLGTPAMAGPMVNDTVFFDEAIDGVAAVTTVTGRGQKITGAVVAFRQPLSAAALTPEALAVTGRKVLAARVTATPDPEAPAFNGTFVVIDLDPADDSALVFDSNTDSAPQIVVTQTQPLTLADGGTLAPGEKGIINTALNNGVVDQFQTGRFTDPQTGLILNYNLYAPRDMAAGQLYPLVLFMHDAGVTGTNPRRTLQQGLGAVSFASADDQARHPGFVLAPQYPVALANDASQTSVYADITVRLIGALTRNLPIDAARLYATGQSGGCMTSIALNVAYPDLFAGTLCVAGQWDATTVAPMARNKFWAIVSEDDAKAYPGMRAITEALAAEGATVTEGTLDAKAPPEVTAAAVAEIRARGADSNVFFTHFTAGSVLPEGGDNGPGAGHVNTWVYAYDIPALRDWLFEQHR